MTSPNPLRSLSDLGQSLWVDDLRRIWLSDGTLQRWMDDDGITGVTSNPAILERSISAGGEYRQPLAELAARALAPAQVCETLALQDVRMAADLLAPVHEVSSGRDGFVSLEVSPLLADDTGETLHEARRLWRELDRPNVMIKVPATAAGVPAIRELIAEAVNVNVTLIFGLRRYAQVVDAFLDGLEMRVARGLGVADVSSVASFFISRIDTAIDARLDALATGEARALRGVAATACAQLAHGHYRRTIAGERWGRLQQRGARTQRLLWASTSTKDPAYDELKYVEALIAADTINTVPRQTLDAYRQRGRPQLRLGTSEEAARRQLAALQDLGIDMEATAGTLEREGVRKFVEPYQKLLAAIASRSAASPA